MPIITVSRMAESAVICRNFADGTRVCVIIEAADILSVIEKLHAVLRMNAADAAIKAAEQQASGEV